MTHKITIFFLVALSIGFGCRAGSADVSSKDVLNLDHEIRLLEEFSKSYTLIKNRYVDQVDSGDLMRAAIKGMARSLDPYSDLLTKEEFEKLELHSVGKYVGIGLTVQKSGHHFVVTQVYKDSPAGNAGIKPGDRIVSINQQNLEDKPDSEILRLLLGKAGSSVELEIVPTVNQELRLSKTVQRQLIKVNSVECSENVGDIKLITIFQFMKHTAKEVSRCLRKESYEAVILDLRNNPGGLLIASVEVAELFLEMGEIVQIRNRRDQLIEKYISRKAEGVDTRLYVLINRYSASAAEILAGAIKDRQVGTLVGEKSFGKGVVQSVYPVSQDLYIKLTTAYYYTPSGININGSGIEPDIMVEDNNKLNRYDNEDAVYQQTLQLIRQE